MSKKSSSGVFVSIIVPVYNPGKFLTQCVDSIIIQTFKDFEVILVDDGSVDESPNICDEYAKKDFRIKAIHQKNCGQTKARKVGLKEALGDYIFFVDADDWLEPNALEVVHKCVVENDADIVTFDSYFNYSHHQSSLLQPVPSGCFDKKGLIENIYPKMIYSGKFFYYGIYAAMWNKIFRRSNIEPNLNNVNDRIKIGEDGVATFAAFLDAQKICILGGQFLYNYRDNNASITRSYCNEQFDGTLILINALYDISRSKGVYDLSRQIDYYLMYCVRSIFNEEFYYRYKKSFSARYSYLKQVAFNKTVLKVSRNISIDEMPRSVKIFIRLLRNNNFKLLILVTLYTAILMRIKLQVRKVTNKY